MIIQERAWGFIVVRDGPEYLQLASQHPIVAAAYDSAGGRTRFPWEVDIQQGPIRWHGWWSTRRLTALLRELGVCEQPIRRALRRAQRSHGLCPRFG